MVKNPFALSIESIVSQLASDKELGLTKVEARKRLENYGPNQVPSHEPKKRWRILVDQFMDPIIYILLVASVLAFVFSDAMEGFAILIVILISVGIGFFMELQAIRSLEELRKMGLAVTRVIREGEKVLVKASEIVPGDIILVHTGDVIPADARLIQVENLSLKESALTGESVPVIKKIDILPYDSPITDLSNMLFRGTTVVNGSGGAIVTATGRFTQLGIIQQMGIDAAKELTPLEKKLNRLSTWLIWLTLFFAVAIVLAGYIRGKDFFLMIETGVALAVAAIPEGLPVVATIALAQGMLRLSKKKIIIKKLEAVQTLGSTDIICTDKTGTLTQDQMKVHSLAFGNTVISNAYQKELDFFDLQKELSVFDHIVKGGVLCNNIDPTSKDVQGDSIELALLDFAKYLNYDVVSIKKNNLELFELPFDSERKLMATVHKQGSHYNTYVKGAYESVVIHCDFYLDEEGSKSFDNREKWFDKVEALAGQGLRTLAFAYKETLLAPTKEAVLQKLVFLGVIGFLDPARKDVKAIIDIYKNAGIKVVMITGDHPGTSRKIAEEIGLLNTEISAPKVLHGKDFEIYQDSFEKNGKSLLDVSVFARVTPRQKLDLVQFYQRNNHIVGMIGDGINDVPALKKADIGIAMGIRGTEAAREVADVILKNDKFAAIEMAIRQGRVIFENIRQFVIYLLSCNLAEIVSVGIAALLNLPSPLLPLQILFLNLVTDIFPALALGLGKGEPDIMNKSPRNPKDPILKRKDWRLIFVYGLCISAAVLGIVFYANTFLGLPSDQINNVAFHTLVLAQLLNVFNVPSDKTSFFKNEVTTNPWIWGAIVLSLAVMYFAYEFLPVSKVLSLEPLSLALLGLSLLFAIGSLVLSQLIKRAGSVFQ